MKSERKLKIADNKDKPPLLAIKGRKRISAFPLTPNEQIKPVIKREKAKEKKREN